MPDWKRDLKRGQLHRFQDWPQVRRDVPTKPGVYTIWDQEGRFIYVGIATERRGLRARLAEHANGGRGGDKFNVYIADRVLLPRLTPEQISGIGDGTLSFDALVKEHNRDCLAVRVHVTATDEDARQLEKAIRAGRWPGGKPWLNPK